MVVLYAVCTPITKWGVSLLAGFQVTLQLEVAVECSEGVVNVTSEEQSDLRIGARQKNSPLVVRNVLPIFGDVDPLLRASRAMDGEVVVEVRKCATCPQEILQIGPDTRCDAELTITLLE